MNLYQLEHWTFFPVCGLSQIYETPQSHNPSIFVSCNPNRDIQIFYYVFCIFDFMITTITTTIVKVMN